MADFYFENKEQIISRRETYQSSQDRIKKNHSFLKNQLKVKEVITPSTSDETELNTILLALKQVIKLLSNEEDPLKPISHGIQVIEVEKNAKIELVNGKLILPLKFPEEELKKIIFK